MSEEITFEEHEIIGMIGKILNVKLTKREVEIFNKAKNKIEGRRLSNHWKKAEKHLSEFRNHMEEIMIKDYPTESSTGIYYGKREELDIIKLLIKYMKTKEENSNGK